MMPQKSEKALYFTLLYIIKLDACETYQDHLLY